MGIQKIDLVKKSAFLLADTPLIPKKHLGNRFPAINHLLAHSYAEILEPLLDFSSPDKDAKSVSYLYVKLFSHTAKHMIHKYNRQRTGTYRLKCWGLYDFVNKQGKLYPYVEYPRTEDLCSLKREVMNRTTIKVNNEEMDMALSNINEKAADDFTEYYMSDFQIDFEYAHMFWNIMTDYMITVREADQATQDTKSN